MRSKRAWMGVSFLVGLRQTFKIEINLIDACETSAAAWHNKHPPICDGAMRTNFVVVVLFVQRDEITFWGVKMMSENAWFAKSEKVGVHKTTNRKSREQRPIRCHCTSMHKCNENSIFGTKLVLDGFRFAFALVDLVCTLYKFCLFFSLLRLLHDNGLWWPFSCHHFLFVASIFHSLAKYVQMFRIHAANHGVVGKYLQGAVLFSRRNAFLIKHAKWW